MTGSTTARTALDLTSPLSATKSTPDVPGVFFAWLRAGRSAVKPEERLLHCVVRDGRVVKEDGRQTEERLVVTSVENLHVDQLRSWTRLSSYIHSMHEHREPLTRFMHGSR